MTQGNTHIHQLETNYYKLMDTDRIFIPQNKKCWLIALTISLVILGLLCYTAHHELSPFNLFAYAIFSLMAGDWILTLSQFFLWLVFVYRCKKMQSFIHIHAPLVINALKKTRRWLIQLSVSTVLLPFGFFVVLAQRHYDDGILYRRT